MSDHNTEIWSTRVQRELLALTTEPSGDGGGSSDVVAVLPAFITLGDRELDIAAGVCRVSFAIHIPGGNNAAATKEETATSPTTTTDGEGTEAPSPPTEKQEEDDKRETISEQSAVSSDDEIVVSLDASLPRKNTDGSIDNSAGMYPFQKPRAILKSGASRFPPGSTVQNGNMVDIDCDWTPSLHLSDAAVNVGLKMKESVLQQEPFHAAQEPAARESDPVDEIVQTARRFGSNIGRSIRSTLKIPGATSEGASAPKQPQQPVQEAPARPRSKRTGRKSPQPSSKPKANPADIKIGDEINLLESPWVECRGVYSCKAIRRPEFAEDAIAHAASLTSNEVSQQTNVNADDGEVPDHLGTYMRMQAGAIGQVCVFCSNQERGVFDSRACCNDESKIIMLMESYANKQLTMTFFMFVRSAGCKCWICWSWSHVPLVYSDGAECVGGGFHHDHGHARD
jgi:hypothetical protein